MSCPMFYATVACGYIKVFIASPTERIALAPRYPFLESFDGPVNAGKPKHLTSASSQDNASVGTIAH